jgi:hypothetical protein
MLLRALVAVLAFATIPNVIVATAVHAQDNGPLTKKLSELAERKGYENAPLGNKLCEAFGWSRADCASLTFQVPYREANGISYVFNSVRIPDKTLRIVFIISDESGIAWLGFWTDLDGTLRACTNWRQKGTKVPNLLENPRRVSCQEANVITKFSDVIAYWQKQQFVLEKEPDRKD